MHSVYTTAIMQLLAAGTPLDTVLVNLRTVLATRGHSRLLPVILKGVVRALEQAAEVTVPVVTIADATRGASVADITTALRALGAPVEGYMLQTDERMVGGLIATYQFRQIDQSYRTKLRNLYQSIVAN